LIREFLEAPQTIACDVRPPAPIIRVKVPNGYKQCGTCGAVLPIADFSDDNSRRDGKDKRCKMCKSYYKKLWRVRHFSDKKDIEDLKVLEKSLQLRQEQARTDASQYDLMFS
jgi:hypothetical protein